MIRPGRRFVKGYALARDRQFMPVAALNADNRQWQGSPTVAAW
jgi:hypothetical protein